MVDIQCVHAAESILKYPAWLYAAILTGNIESGDMKGIVEKQTAVTLLESLYLLDLPLSHLLKGENYL